jgi:hypothetical protein
MDTPASCYRSTQSLLGQLTDFCNVRSGLEILFLFFTERRRRRSEEEEDGEMSDTTCRPETHQLLSIPPLPPASEQSQWDHHLITKTHMTEDHIYMSTIDIPDREEYQPRATLSSTVSDRTSAWFAAIAKMYNRAISVHRMAIRSSFRLLSVMLLALGTIYEASLTTKCDSRLLKPAVVPLVLPASAAPWLKIE